MFPLVLLACSHDFVGEESGLGADGTVPSGDGPEVWLNEVMARNDSTVMHGTFEFPDWIEVYNPGTAAVPLSRLVVSCGGDSWRGPDWLSVGPRGHYVLFGCDDDDDDPQCLGFGLDGTEETITLAIDGEVGDTVTTPDLDADVSYARFPDGGEWAQTIRATPGAMNGTVPTTSTDPSDLLFETNDIEDFWITIPSASWTTLQANRFEQVLGSLAWRGAFFPEIQLTTKGYVGSSRGLDQKAGWKLDLNHYADHRLAGLEKLTFNNMVQDPSYVHEQLTYRLYRAMGVPAPRIGYAHLYINGAYWGLYVDIETPDDRFLARWWEDNSGALYEGAYGVDFYAGYEYSFDYDEGPDPNDRSDLTALIQALDRPADDAGITYLETLLDLDNFLAMMAVEAVALHWDGYTTANNYRVYHDPTSGRFTMIPWGTDQTFHDFWYMPYSGGGRIFQYCMSNSGCIARYTEKLRETAAVLEGLGLSARLEEMVGFLGPSMESDPRREWGMDTVYSYLDTTRYYLSSQPSTIRSQLR